MSEKDEVKKKAAEADAAIKERKETGKKVAGKSKYVVAPGKSFTCARAKNKMLVEGDKISPVDVGGEERFKVFIESKHIVVYSEPIVQESESKSSE